MDVRRVLTRRGTVRLVGAIVLVSLAGTASARTSAPTPGPTPLAVLDACADANGDHLLTVTDGVLALQAAADLPSPCTRFTCDVDGNGAITVTDGVGILRRAAGLGNFFQFFECPVPRATHDFSDFRIFRFERQSAFGFCPEVGSVVNVDVERQSDGQYHLQLMVAGERPRGDPECVLPFPADDPTCTVRDPRPDRSLTTDEVDRLRAAFAAIEIAEVRHPHCAVGHFDPCVITELAWDDVEAQDWECNAPRVSTTTTSMLIDVLTTLVPPAASD